jgi:hypothetical protein
VLHTPAVGDEHANLAGLNAGFVEELLHSTKGNSLKLPPRCCHAEVHRHIGQACTQKIHKAADAQKQSMTQLTGRATSHATAVPQAPAKAKHRLTCPCSFWQHLLTDPMAEVPGGRLHHIA